LLRGAEPVSNIPESIEGGFDIGVFKRGEAPLLKILPLSFEGEGGHRG
jgi:hypothetical protein